MITLEQYKEACNYPGRLDQGEVEKNLRAYLKALGVKRTVRRLERGWKLDDHPAIERAARSVLDDFAKWRDALVALDARDARGALDARDAQDARDARDALHRFTEWLIHGCGRAWSWDLSWLATSAFGARQTKSTSVGRWSEPLLSAFDAGCWMLFWTDDTLYWIAKPRAHIEQRGDARRLHRADGPALESDVEVLYFWHGVLVDHHVIMNPKTITREEIDAESNQEVRRVLIERFGYDKYMHNAQVVHEDATGKLRKQIVGNDTICVVEVVNGTCEPDGSFKKYVLSVPPEITTAIEAVAWTYGLSAKEYVSLQVRT